MNIGNRIYELRSERRMSQEDLAEKLDVSRQSVSKWETALAVPELDKLMKLCDLFGVTMDQLVGRTQIAKDAVNPGETDKKPPSATQKAVGYILFTVSVIFGFIILLFGKNEGDYIVLLPIAFSLLVCGILCLFAGKRAFYWCVWTVCAPIAVVSPFVVSVNVFGGLFALLVILAIVMALVARRAFEDVTPQVEKRKSILLICGWVLTVGILSLNVYISFFLDSKQPMVANSGVTGAVLGLICYVLLAFIETYTVCYLKKRK